LTSPLQAGHIHFAMPGMNGAVILPFPNLPAGATSGTFSGMLTAANLTPVDPILTFDQAVAALEAGNTYTNLHTANFPGGEIRGQNPAPPAPVVVTGYSADVISDKDPSVRFAQPFDGDTFAWFEAGLVDDSGTQHNDGLPAGLTFVSATGSGATYQIQAANAKSVLQLSTGQTGTLTLTTPAAYTMLYVIGSSGNGQTTSVGSGNINFTDGSTQAFSYNTFDWCNGSPGGLHPEGVLTGTHARTDVGPNGTAFAYNGNCDFQIYETVVAIDPSHAGVAIASIDFTGAPDAPYSNIFGVSGK
jgi:hypothetical protein